MLTVGGDALGDALGNREDVDAPTEHLAVLGSPITHSKSPAIHSAAYRELGLAWSYGREELRAEQLEGFLAARSRGWRGFSLTMPLKEEAHRLASVRDPVADESGVVNTLLRLDSERQPWAGFNTDVGGLAAAVRNAGLDASSTIVLGSGATAVSAVLAARRLGARHVEVVARNVTAVSNLVARFGDTQEPGLETPMHMSGTLLPHVAHLLREPTTEAATLVISTLPGTAARDLVLPDRVTAIPLFDVAYDPWPSPLAKRWREFGGEAHSGMGMLVEQAILQIRIFVNGDPGVPLVSEDRVRAAMNAAVAGMGE